MIWFRAGGLKLKDILTCLKTSSKFPKKIDKDLIE